MNRTRVGQALIELSLCIWIFVLALSGTIEVVRRVQLKQNVLHVCRLGTELLAETDMSREDIRDLLWTEIKSWRIHPASSIQIKLGPYQEHSSAAFYDLVFVRIIWDETAVVPAKWGFRPLCLDECVVVQKENQHENNQS